MSTVPVRTISAVCALALTLTVGVVIASTPENVEQLKATNACVGCDLFGAELQGFKGEGADLSGANLGEATFYGGSLKGANLTGAILDGANLNMVNLEGAIGVVFSTAETDSRTICPNGSAGPCE